MQNNLANYLTATVASATYQTALSVASAASGLFRLLTTRPGNSTQYIGSLNFPSGSLFGAIISASTPDIISLDDSNFYTTFYTQSQSDTKYATKSNPAFTGTPTLGGTDFNTLYKPWVIATIDGTTGNVSSSSGKASVSCSRTGTGSYTVSYTSTPSGAPSAVLLTLRNSTGFAQYSGSTGSSLNVSTRNTSATLTDATFSIVAYL